jgi:hypothetical protein
MAKTSGMARVGLTTIKTLFACSCNRCAFPGCDQRLTDPQWRSVRADIAHIRGEKPGAARYVPEMSDAERNGIDNLMLLCPNHHREIDRLRPQDWPAERLMEVKLTHERDCTRATIWASDGDIEDFASMLLTLSEDAQPGAPSPSLPRSDAPRLAVRRGRKDVFEVANVGASDAFDISVEPAPGGSPDAVLRISDESLPRLSPGGSWEAGLHLRTFGDAGPSRVIVRWRDDHGIDYDAEFPL